MKQNLYDYIFKIFANYLHIFKNETNDKINKLLKESTYNEEEINKLNEELKNMNFDFKKFKNDYIILSNNQNELKKRCLETNIYNYFKKYSIYLSKKNQSLLFDEEKQKFILENILLPFKLFDIDCNKEENIQIIYNVNYNEDEIFQENSFFGNIFYEQFLKIKKEIEYISLKNYKEEIIDLIYKDNKFMEDFFEIIKSEPISFYLNSKKKYDNSNKFLVEFLDENNDIQDYDQCLKKQFEQFLKDFNMDYDKFRKIIIIQEIAYKIPAFTSPSMRIFINPKLQFSEEVKNDKAQMKSILKSALIIILIHELIHLLNFYPIDDTYPLFMPITPKERENGKCLIYYLFGNDTIYKINYSQSCLINNINTWKKKMI